MKSKLICFTFILLLTIALAGQSSGNLDYRKEEASIISWDGVNFIDSRALSLGNVSLMASELFSQGFNPALFSSSKKPKLGLSLNYINYQSFQYWGMNEGVWTYLDDLNEKLLNIGSFTINVPFNNLHFSIGYGYSALFSFPDFIQTVEYNYGETDISTGNFSGQNQMAYFASGIRVSNKLNLGIRIEYLFGERDVHVSDVESYWFWNETINNYIFKILTRTKDETHSQQEIKFILGGVYNISKQWNLGAYIKIPVWGEVTREVLTAFNNSYDNLSIDITNQGTDTLFSPPQFSLATTFMIPLFKEPITLGLELGYGLWAKYKYILFSEEMDRDMRNTFNLKLGAEIPFFIGGKEQYLRMGFRLESQPLKDPATTLNVVTAGIGFSLWKFNLDLGMAYFFTSNLHYNQDHMVASSTLSFSF